MIEPECGIHLVDECSAHVGYPDGHKHVFTGFSWGFSIAWIVEDP